MHVVARTALSVALLTSLVAAPLLATAQETPLLIDGVQDGQAQHRIPSLPIFFGEAYEGVLSPENGALRQTYRQWTERQGNFNVAYFDIELLEGDIVSYGLTTDGADLLIDFFHLDTDKEGNPSWVWAATAAHGASSNGCIVGRAVGKAGQYRIRLSTMAPDTVARYRFHLLPVAKPMLCGKRLDEDTRQFLAGPAQPASLPLARSWEGRERPKHFRMPAPFVQPDTPDAIAYAQSKRSELQPFYKTLYLDGEHNAVLNFQRLGLAAMEAGAWAEAEWAFDEALARIEAVYGKTSIASDARSKWNAEGIKDFKGEPYERVMAYYYRGLLYLREGDYQNARASFMAGEFQDTLSEAEEFQGDFALMNYLSGWSSYCMGDTVQAGDAFAVAKQVNSAVQMPGKENTLLIADLGRGPVKMARGTQHKLLAFAESMDAGRGEQAHAAIAGNAQQRPLSEYSDVYFQATTRGGRAFDAILDGKASLKNNLVRTYGVGEALTQSGMPALQLAGLAIAVVSGGVGGQVKSQADTRVWDTLPDHVSLGLAKVEPTAAISFSFDGNESAAPGPTPVMRAHHGQCGIAWSRSRSALAVPPGAPGNDEDTVKERSKNKEALQRDAAFRTTLRDGAVAGAATNAL
ncbi:hypothetical protein [Lysobacter niastensis]|uniref:Tetratricopeptide repeat protein n=1 Tax=Lysobacter niastensis TaxID=380629 RepID=A0ABS0B3Z0_9GAMM|nr:hypothetical protein [Lysobacter niastensis]MBF6023225.1 hypothetical protein [Lysobacter niastensis]